MEILALLALILSWWLVLRRDRPPLPPFIAHWTDPPCADPDARYRLALDETSTHELDHALRVAAGAKALDELRAKWREIEAQRKDVERRQQEAAWTIYAPPARERERLVLVLKRRRTA